MRPGWTSADGPETRYEHTVITPVGPSRDAAKQRSNCLKYDRGTRTTLARGYSELIDTDKHLNFIREISLSLYGNFVVFKGNIGGYALPTTLLFK